MDCSPPGSSGHRILQARTLEWVAIPFSRGCPWPRIEPRSSASRAGSLPSKPPGKSHKDWQKKVSVKRATFTSDTENQTHNPSEVLEGQWAPAPSDKRKDKGQITFAAWRKWQPSNPLQYPCPGNLTERGAWRATLHGGHKSQTGPND